MASQQGLNSAGNIGNNYIVEPEQRSSEASQNVVLKTQMAPCTYVYPREIRPKEVTSKPIGDPPMKKMKTEVPLNVPQNGFQNFNTSTAPPMTLHNTLSSQPSNPLSKLHELNKNINSSSFNSTQNKASPSSFASIVHSETPSANILFGANSAANVPPVRYTPKTTAPVINIDAKKEFTIKPEQPHKVPEKNVPTPGTTEGQTDALASLDWKDGVADLPGSKLKFKMTEFGLEIISTVDTEDGEVEFSTPTPSTSTTATTAVTTTESNDIKTEIRDSNTENDKDSPKQEGATDENEFCCCEICGKYGLRSEFGATGRFCGLTCVGVYTGRRNKGREISRHVKAFDNKIKRKKRKGRKLTSIKQSSVNGEGPDGKTKDYVSVRIDMTNAPKPFNWAEYLEKTNTQAADETCFSQENPGKELFITPAVEFRKDMKMEAVDPKHPSYFCVVTIAEVKGGRLRLHFDGWSESYDFWANADSEFIFPVNWCSKNSQSLQPPRSMTGTQFSWDQYLRDTGAVAAPEHLFKSKPQPTKHGFKKGMKLEAIDRKNPDLICVATVTNILGNRFLVHFDEWDDTYDYWCFSDCPYIHPVGWCESQGRRLTPPNDDEIDTFVWSSYLRATGCKAAPSELFETRIRTAFKKGTKLEVVDRRNPSLIRCGTIIDATQYKLRIHFDGWDELYDDWFDADSTDLHPIGWCEKSSHPLEAPITAADKLNTVSCPTPGCKGIGHVKGAKYTTHHSQFGCPYSLQNLSKESCLVDRLAANSMAEDSDWSYERRKNSVGRSKKVPVTPVSAVEQSKPSPPAAFNDALGVCPTTNCDGRGHITGKFSTHHSVSGCPLSEVNREKMYKPILPKTHVNYQKSYIKGHKPNKPSIISTRSASKSDRMPSYKSKSRHDQGIQVEGGTRRPGNHRSPFSRNVVSFSVYSDVYNTGISPHINHGARSSERNNVLSWTAQQVSDHVKSIGCLNQAQIFIDQKIDGEAFLLLQQADLVNILKIKLGPAVKIYSSILKFL